MTCRAYTYFIATFLLGVVVGGVGVFLYAWHWGRWHRGFARERVIHELTRELDLSETQVGQLRRIMDDSEKKFREVRKQVRPQFDAIREESHERVRQILNPEQVEKFNALIRRQDGRRRGNKPPPSPRGSPPGR